jgi:hypothetical protein
VVTGCWDVVLREIRAAVNMILFAMNHPPAGLVIPKWLVCRLHQGFA